MNTTTDDQQTLLDDRPYCAAPGCYAVLLPGFDPPGDRCRHHATKRTDQPDQEAA